MSPNIHTCNFNINSAPVNIAMTSSCLPTMLSITITFTRTTSAASTAISVPVPIAIPMSAWARAGLSLIPSPTMATWDTCTVHIQHLTYISQMYTWTCSNFFMHNPRRYMHLHISLLEGSNFVLFMRWKYFRTDIFLGDSNLLVMLVKTGSCVDWLIWYMYMYVLNTHDNHIQAGV